jgi:diguanylate cyclase (GGDEF)-like protein/PAS domain S-box-containing protein
MSDITGFSWKKFSLSIFMLSIFMTAGVVLFHWLFSLEIGLLVSTCLILCFFCLSGFCLLFIIKKTYQKHLDIVKNLLNAINEVIIIKDYQGNFVYCNDTVGKLYGSDPKEMVGKDDYYFTKNREQADFFRENVQAIMQRFQREDVYESTTDTQTGETRHFQSIKIPFLDMQKQLKILVFAKDITDITLLKEEAIRNKARLEHVLDVSEEGLWEWNIHTNKVMHNNQWEKITGIERTDNSFKEFENCILPEDKQMVSKALQMLIEENLPYSIEFRMKRPDGNVIWIWDRGRVAEYDIENKPVWLVGIALDITTKKLNQQKIANLAYYDQLTGLINRTQLEVELKNVIKQSEQQDCYSALLFLDLDRFKLLNDTYGHHMGDKLLECLSTRLQDIDKGRGIISRFGGDEFVIVLPLVDQQLIKATKLVQQYADKMVVDISNVLHLESDMQDVSIEYSITASIGGVVFKSGDISTGKLLQLADIALYRTKARGGHSAKIFDAHLQDELSYASELQKAMHHSDINRDFHIYFQPKYSVNEQIIGAEALVRWDHPTLGLQQPTSFIEMAEESNLIISIGEMMLNQACKQLKKWQSSENTRHLQLSVNLSAKQIWKSYFVEDYIKMIDAYQIDHSKLTLEVTESVLIQDINDAIEKLSRLKQYGVMISLDDFGTGYSSLSYLRSLPIDEIKIDRSFIKDLTTDEQAHLMVKSICELARNFNLNVVAEGVEQREQLNSLKQLGISIYQGFYFSKPITEKEMQALLSQQIQPKK